MISVDFDFSGISASLDRITAAANEAVRPAAQAGAQVLYNEVRARVPVSDAEHSTKGGKHTFRPGNLRDAVYQAYADDDSGKGRAVYRVSWNKNKAFYGRFVEFGTSRMAARPFLRPAWDAAQASAVRAVETRIAQAVKEAIS